MSIILDKLRRQKPFSNARAIIACVGKGTVTPEESDAIKSHIDNNQIVLGYPISDFAYAALDILGIIRNYRKSTYAFNREGVK